MQRAFTSLKVLTLLFYAVLVALFALYDGGLSDSDWDYCDQYSSCYDIGCCQQAIAERDLQLVQPVKID